MLKRHRPIFIFYLNQYQDVIRVSFYCSLKMAAEEGRNGRNKPITITLAVIFMIKILASSQLYRLRKSWLHKKKIIRRCLVFGGQVAAWFNLANFLRCLLTKADLASVRSCNVVTSEAYAGTIIVLWLLSKSSRVYKRHCTIPPFACENSAMDSFLLEANRHLMHSDSSGGSWTGEICGSSG